MIYETRNFQELIEYMASCEKLGLLYIVQKFEVPVERFFRKDNTEPLYRLTVVEYTDEEVEENDRPSG